MLQASCLTCRVYGRQNDYSIVCHSADSLRTREVLQALGNNGYLNEGHLSYYLPKIEDGRYLAVALLKCSKMVLLSICFILLRVLNGKRYLLRYSYQLNCLCYL